MYGEEKKTEFLKALADNFGVIAAACKAVDINYSTVKYWQEKDLSFAQEMDDISEIQCDLVEYKLMQRINAGDVSAITFYLKTKGKKRGWNERYPAQAASDNVQEGSGVDEKEYARLIKSTQSNIVRVLKKEGKYTKELDMQIGMTAKLLVRTDILYKEISSSGHQAVNVEISREGSARETISPREKLYLDCVQQSQKALRALGMNTDSKERKTDNDTFGKFLEDFSEK